MKFEITKQGFTLDNKPFRLFSGAMHYFRVVEGYWKDRMLKMKAAGFNAVETVMCWNLHEPIEGQFDFSGMLDITKFCKLAQELGLYVVIRPGPYTCGEWDNGGFPAWLLKDKNVQLRCNEPRYLSKFDAYFKRVFQELAPLQITRGGNILMMQIENEYGSYGNDKEYLKHIEDFMRSNDIDVPLFTSDGTDGSMLSGGTLPHIYKTLNFGSRANTAFNCLSELQPDMPKTNMEFWCGWFDHWGRMHHRRNPVQVTKEIQSLVDIGANINIYMFHGGTNFNFWAGANYDSKYRPVTTSYDDAALLNEYGDYTAAFHGVRKVLHAAQGLPLGELPPSPKMQNIGNVELKESADLWSNLYNLGQMHKSAHPEPMECFGQNFGYILYKTCIKGNYGNMTLHVEGVRDIAYLKVNGEIVCKYDRTKVFGVKDGDGFKFKLPSFKGECKIEILVEGMGRINYGPRMGDMKGIKRVRLNNQVIFGWDIYTLPMDNLDKVRFDGKASCGASILKGSFMADKTKDCFLDTKGFTKGFAIVNGFNIGRYWSKGPQRTLYIPAPLLKENNEIIIVEQEKYKSAVVTITDKHNLG